MLLYNFLVVFIMFFLWNDVLKYVTFLIDIKDNCTQTIIVLTFFNNARLNESLKLSTFDSL